MTDKSNLSSAQAQSEGAWDEEIDFRNLLHSIRKTRGLVTVVASLVLIAMIGLLALSRVAIPTTYTYKQALQFTFSSVANQKYPNGSKFAISDLSAPLVLQKVYDDNRLHDFGMKMKDFISSVSIYPYSLGYEAVLTRYRYRLADKKLMFAERVQIEQNMAKELEQHQGRSAILGMTVTSRLGLPKSLAEKILNDIAKSWAKVSIGKYGVLKLPGVIGVNDLISPAEFDHIDAAVAAVRLIETNLRVVQRLKELREIDGAATVIDIKSQQSVDAMQRKVAVFASYDLDRLLSDALNRSDKPALDRLRELLERRKSVMEVQKRGYADKATSLQKRLKEYNRDQTAVTELNASSRTGPAPVQGTSVAQISPGFVKQILALSEQKLEIKFKQELVEKQLKFREQEINKNVEIENLKALISILDRHVAGRSARNVADPEANLLREKISAAVKVVNENWRVIGRFYDMLGIKRLSYNSSLYRGLELSVGERFSSYHPLYDKKTWSFILAGVLAAAFLAMFVGLFQQFMRRS